MRSCRMGTLPVPTDREVWACGLSHCTCVTFARPLWSPFVLHVPKDTSLHPGVVYGLHCDIRVFFTVDAQGWRDVAQSGGVVFGEEGKSHQAVGDVATVGFGRPGDHLRHTPNGRQRRQAHWSHNGKPARRLSVYGTPQWCLLAS